ncbi:MAG: RNA polymerase subunit sigma-70 [Lachnospiraceae bacterium]|nr:RNA polymerase subunit sigma-70 [Lachnospiraceae bacterium]
MKKEMMEQIIGLRKQGMSYQQITDAVGVKRATVRYVCYKHGLSGRAKDLMIQEGKLCASCGAPIVQPAGGGRRRRFCSVECRRKWWKEHPEMSSQLPVRHLTCLCCGKPFISFGPKERKYCSRDCYIEHRFWVLPALDR